MALIKPNTSKNTISATLSRIAFAPFSLTFYIICKIAELIYFLAATFVHVVISPFVWAHSFFKKRTPFSTRGLQMSSSVSINRAYGPAADIGTGQLDAKETDPHSSQLELVEVPVKKEVFGSCTPRDIKCTLHTANHEKLEKRVDTQQMSATVSHANAQPDTKVEQSTIKLAATTRKIAFKKPNKATPVPSNKATPDPRYIALKLLSFIPTLTVKAVNEKDKSTPQSSGTSANATQTVQDINYWSTLISYDGSSEQEKAFSEVIISICLLLSVIELPLILAQESLKRKDIDDGEKSTLLSDYELKLSKAIGKLFRHILQEKCIEDDKKKIIDQFKLLTDNKAKCGFGIDVSDESTSPILTAQANFLTHLAGVDLDTSADLGHLTAALESLIVKTYSLQKNLRVFQEVSDRANSLYEKKTDFNDLVFGEMVFRDHFMKACGISNDPTGDPAKQFSKFLSELSKKAHNLALSRIPSDWDPLLKIFELPVNLATMHEDDEVSETSSTCGDSGCQKK